MRRVLAFAPASIGNFAAGFDVLGAAVEPDGAASGPPLGDRVEIARADADSFAAHGPFAHRLPARAGDNLALKACAEFARAWGQPLPPLAIRLEKNLPVGSGLGSSSATVVATLAALDALLETALEPAVLLRLAGETEAHGCGAAHLDNVAPSLLGGLLLMDPQGQARPLPFPRDLAIVLASPALELSTRTARQVLPGQIDLELAVAHAQNLAGLVHALHTGNAALRRSCLRDLLAEPHRAPLVPGFRAVQAAALEQGAEGCTLSGAGPAMFALAARDRAAAVAGAMDDAWRAAGIDCQVRLCRVAGQGARILETH
jgi:homoserine kinase